MSIELVCKDRVLVPRTVCVEARVARVVITTGVSRVARYLTECIVSECHVDRAGCSAYSIAMRTVCDVAYSLGGNSCNFAE